MSGFKKRTATKGPTIRGTVISPKTLQLLTSSGASSLDSLINGGFPVGTIALIEDFTISTDIKSASNKTLYSKVLIKQFLEEGSSYDHDIFVGSCGDKFSLISGDTSEKEEIQKSQDETSGLNTSMKIAWRYQNQNTSQNDEKASCLKITNDNDSSSKITYDTTESRVFTWHITDVGASLFQTNVYNEILKNVSKACENPKLNLPTSASSTSSSSSLIRIAITDIGSLLSCDQDTHRFKLMQFLYALKSLARNRLCVVAITQTSNIENLLDVPNLQNSIREMVDFVFQFNALKKDNNEVDSKKKSHHGIFNIIKTPSLRCLKSPSMRNHGKYLFKSTKNKFVLERMHLPPELGYAADTPKQSIDF